MNYCYRSRTTLLIHTVAGLLRYETTGSDASWPQWVIYDGIEWVDLAVSGTDDSAEIMSAVTGFQAAFAPSSVLDALVNINCLIIFLLTNLAHGLRKRQVAVHLFA